MTFVLVERCRGCQLLRRAAEKWRPTWCLSSRRNSTGVPNSDGSWGPANHSTTTERPLRRSVTDRLVGSGGRPVFYPRTQMTYWLLGYEIQNDPLLCLSTIRGILHLKHWCCGFQRISLRMLLDEDHKW